MEIIEYFSDDRQEHWKDELAKADWGAARFLVELLNDIQRRTNIVGEGGKLFLMIDGKKIVSFVTLTHQDCIRDESLYPWFGFLFTYPEYRGSRYSEKLLNYAGQIAKQQGYSKVYLATDHEDLYERFGFQYIENRLDYWNEDSRIYCKHFD